MKAELRKFLEDFWEAASDDGYDLESFDRHNHYPNGIDRFEYIRGLKDRQVQRHLDKLESLLCQSTNSKE